jgi:HSP20 family protein
MEAHMAEKTTMAPTQREGQLTRRMPSTWNARPWGTLQRFTDEIDRIFDDFGFGHRSWSAPLARTESTELWAPEIDMFQRNNELVIKADLPGLKKDDVKIDVTDEALTIQGERRAEHQEEREGVYRSERSYGSFCRVVPLPEGAMTDQAKATFDNGVLEITMPAPPDQVTRGRRLEISEGTKK